jgi:hypothetical protein
MTQVPSHKRKVVIFRALLPLMAGICRAGSHTLLEGLDG